MPAPRIVATFTGDPVTAFHEGIPARDLTEAMWEKLTPDQQQTIADSKVYDLSPKETKALAEQAEEPSNAPPEVGDVAPAILVSASTMRSFGTPPSVFGDRVTVVESGEPTEGLVQAVDVTVDPAGDAPASRTGGKAR